MNLLRHITLGGCVRRAKRATEIDWFACEQGSFDLRMWTLLRKYNSDSSLLNGLGEAAFALPSTRIAITGIPS